MQWIRYNNLVETEYVVPKTLMNIENCPKVIFHQVADTLQFETHLAASIVIVTENEDVSYGKSCW